MEFVDHQSVFDLIELVHIAIDGRICGEHICESPCLCEVVLAQVVCELGDSLLVGSKLCSDICKLCLAGGGVACLVDGGLQAEDGCDRDEQCDEHIVKKPLGKYFFHVMGYLPFLFFKRI